MREGISKAACVDLIEKVQKQRDAALAELGKQRKLGDTLSRNLQDEMIANEKLRKELAEARAALEKAKYHYCDTKRVWKPVGHDVENEWPRRAYSICLTCGREIIAGHCQPEGGEP